MRSKPVAVVAALIVAVCLVTILRGQCSRTPARSYDDEGTLLMELGALTTYLCEECGAQSVESFRPTPFKCRACGKEAVVESGRYECLACEKTFEAFRRRSVMSSDGKRPVAFEVKLPGGAWQRMKQPPLKCTHCGNEDAGRLRPVAPKFASPAAKGDPLSGLAPP